MRLTNDYSVKPSPSDRDDPLINESGGSDEDRTRDLWRDRPAL